MRNRLLVVALVSLGIFASDANARKFDIKESLLYYTPTLSAEFKDMLKNADVEAGADFFDRKCANCHDHQKGGIHNKGPLLWNVFGRKAGSEKGFEYSESMKKSGHTWTFATLNYYLTRTDRAVPGRIMNFRGIRQDQKRANLLAYLRKFNDTPPDLPE